MIETEEQRRWWFATHPEYSWSHRGIHRPSGEEELSESEKNQDKADPRDVDEYVDHALKYERDESVIALLKSIKRNFGTEAELSREQHNLKAWERILEDGWGTASDGWKTPAGTYADGGLYISEVPRMPTMDELSRWPREMVGQFFKWLDTILRNNPLLIDPNALEGHHGLPLAFITYFMDCGMEVDEFIMIMRASDHRLKDGPEGRGGVHTGKGRGGAWNREWREFIRDHPRENSKERQEQIRDKHNEMVKTFGLEGKYILSPKRPRKK
ncbi:MAG TPA: DUF2380 domain-containing protein [Desulfomonilaceae bacterium]|nr:DUF2380 domain-containing protein [Desulfomonilaceae bacterium]